MRWSGLAAALLAPPLFVTPAFAQTPVETLKHGEYVFKVAGCATCHTDEDNKGAPLAGGRALKTPFGVFYTPNITPDNTHGIGRWSEADFLRALREGVSPRGEQYFPAFPYTSYTGMSDADGRALWAYLKTRPAVAQANKPHDLKWYVLRPFMRMWKWLYFEPKRFVPAGKDAQIDRGAYIAEALAHCGECHTPRKRLGAMNKDLWLAGNPDGPDGDSIPNITPDKKTGIGRWTRSDLVEYLDSGMTPDGDFAGGAMADVIKRSLRPLTDSDRAALVAYLRALPPIERVVPHERDNGHGATKKPRVKEPFE